MDFRKKEIVVREEPNFLMQINQGQPGPIYMVSQKFVFMGKFSYLLSYDEYNLGMGVL